MGPFTLVPQTSYHPFLLYYTTVPYLLFHTIPYYTILYHTIPYYSILYHTIPYYSIIRMFSIYGIVWHTILYYSILYHTIPYYSRETAFCIIIDSTDDRACNGMEWKTIFPYSIPTIFFHSIFHSIPKYFFHIPFHTKNFFHIPFHTNKTLMLFLEFRK